MLKLLSDIKLTGIKTADLYLPPKDSLSFYFPPLYQKPKADSFTQNWYSSTLFCFKEPILKHNYLGHDVYRFLYLRSFHRPVVIVLHHERENIFLHTKILDRQPVFKEAREEIQRSMREQYLASGYCPDDNNPDLMILEADRHAEIIFNSIKKVSNEEFDDFQQLLKKANFWDLAIQDNQYDGTDGSQFIIEGHMRGQYKVVDRWGGSGDFGNIGHYLIKLSGIKEEIY